MRQETLTVVTPVRAVSEFRQVLQTPAFATRVKQCLARPSLGIHFARLALIEEPEGGPFRSSLVFESNFDTAAPDAALASRDHLRAVVDADPRLFTELFAHGEAGLARADGAALGSYLESHLVPPTAAYQGHNHRDIGRIRLEQALRDAVLTYLETASVDTPDKLFLRIRAYLLSRAEWDERLRGLHLEAAAPALPNAEVRSQGLRSRVWPWIANSGMLVPVLFRLMQIAEWGRRDKYYDLRRRHEELTESERARLRDIAATEDHGVQNALTHVVCVRDGRGRGAILRTAHGYVARLAERYFNDIGQLGGIPSIHFAKWLLLDGGKRLLFLSNYDSSWESYLGDFVDQAAVGLNLAWSCTEEYPATQHLVFGGASDEERFKAWGRCHQRPTQVFYSAYPELSVAAINNNTWIRAALHHAHPGDLDAWYRRLS